jgi:hypothetical protein
MAEPSLENALQRLSRLESQLRWWKGGTAAIGFGVLVLAGMFVGFLLRPDRVSRMRVPATTVNTNPATEIKAQRFLLVDQSGKTLGIIGTWPDGTVGLVFTGGDPRWLKEFFPSETGGKVFGIAGLFQSTQRESTLPLLNGTKTTTAAGVFLNASAPDDPKNVSTELSMLIGRDQKSKRIELTDNNKDGAYLDLSDDNFNSAQISVGGDGASELYFHHQDPKSPTADAILEDDGVPKLTLKIFGQDTSSSPSGQALTATNEALQLNDDKGTIRAALGTIDLEEKQTGLTERRPLSSLTLFDQDGKLIRAIP